VGCLADRYGIKPSYLLGTGLLAGGMLLYALAPTWKAIAAATILRSISIR
jgi:MFS family permease